MRKRDSKRRWKARLNLGKPIPLWVTVLYGIYKPPTEKLKQIYKEYKDYLRRKSDESNNCR